MENTVKNLQSLGASVGMACFMAAAEQPNMRYKVEWAHYEWAYEPNMHTVELEHNESAIVDTLDIAMAAYKAIKRNSHYKGHQRWIHISVSHDCGKSWSGTYFHTQF